MGKSKDLATGAAYQDQTESDTRYANVAGDTFTGLVNITNTYSSDTTEQLRVSDNTGSKLDFFGHANGTKSIQAYADDGSTFYNLNLQPLGGYVTMPNQPAFRVRRNASSLTLTGNNAKQNLIFNVEDFDIGGGYNTTTGKYTVPATGVYFFFLNPRFDGIASDTYARGLIYKGATVASSPWSDYGNVLSSIEGNNHSSDYGTMNVSGIFSCTAGDTIHFLGGGNSDSSITLQAESQAGGFMIG